MEEMVEECAEAAPPLSEKQKAVDYAGDSYNYFSSLSHEMQEKPKAGEPLKEEG
jgi:hypothetical protein